MVSLKKLVDMNEEEWHAYVRSKDENVKKWIAEQNKRECETWSKASKHWVR